MSTIKKALQELFEHSGDATISQQQAAYMKNVCIFAGVKTPLRKVLQKKVFANFIPKTTDELIRNAQQLWNSPYREMQYSALDYLEKHKKLFSPKVFLILERMSEQIPWWDSIDYIATRLIGPLVIKYPQLLANIDAWKKNDSIWKHRIAIIFQLKYKKKTDAVRLFNTIIQYTQRTYEQPFWINKAAGWALREYSKTNPDVVRLFLDEQDTMLSPLTIKEASKYLFQ